MRKPDTSVIGRKFGKLTVVDYAGKSFWNCLCECGGTFQVRRADLNSGNSTTCGCGKGRHTHGLTHTSEYNVHNMMKQRCANPNHTSYPYYGARGIKVCDRWLGSDGLANFVTDMGSKPTPDHKLERVDNDGPYEPSNCVWATQAEQSRNTRRNVHVTYEGETLVLKDWATRLNVAPMTLAYQVKTLGPEAAIRKNLPT